MHCELSRSQRHEGSMKQKQLITNSMLTCKQKGVDNLRGKEGSWGWAYESCAVGLCKHCGLFAMRKTADSLEDRMEFIDIVFHEFVASSLYIYSIYLLYMFCIY